MSLLLLEDKEQIQEHGIPLILFTIHLADSPMLLEIELMSSPMESISLLALLLNQ